MRIAGNVNGMESSYGGRWDLGVCVWLLGRAGDFEEWFDACEAGADVMREIILLQVPEWNGIGNKWIAMTSPLRLYHQA